MVLSLCNLLLNTFNIGKIHSYQTVNPEVFSMFVVFSKSEQNLVISLTKIDTDQYLPYMYISINLAIVMNMNIVVLLTVKGDPCCCFGKPLHMGPLNSLLKRVGNSAHNVSCQMAKSSGTLN